MKKRILVLTFGLLLISINVFAQTGGTCNLSGSSVSGGIFMYNVLMNSGTDDSPYLFANTGRKLYFGTNGYLTNPYMLIDLNGNVGIGTQTPAAKLDVGGDINTQKLNASGDIRLGNSSATCSATNEGAIRYNNTSKKMEFCNGTAWRTFSVAALSIDLQVAASTDDTVVCLDEGVWKINGTSMNDYAGDVYGGYAYKCGAGLRFLNVTIPKGASITTAYLTFKAISSVAVNTVNSRITGDLETNAATFSTLANYQARRGTAAGGANNNLRTQAQITWDSIPAWTVNTAYDSPEIKTIIQEIVNQASWVSGNALVLFWDDHEGRSSQNAYRQSYGYDYAITEAPKLHIEYQVP